MSNFLLGGGYEKWLSELGVTDAPLTRAGVKISLEFFHSHMPLLKRSLRLSFLKGIDLHKPVCVTTLMPGDEVAAFRKCNEDPFKLFYTRAGTNLHTLGVNSSNRIFRRYRVRMKVQVLESRCAAARDTWTDQSTIVIASGGALQYVIPDSFRPLELIQ